MAFHPIHPFPTRMAPELALTRCRSLPGGAPMLAPMAGSGTVPRRYLPPQACETPGEPQRLRTEVVLTFH